MTELRQFREAGKTIGLTHGAFDLLHPGHLYFLKEASAKCGILAVGVDSDEMVSSRKGDQRPVFKQLHRCRLVDNVPEVYSTIAIDFELNDANFINLYKNLKPHIIFIGAGYGAKLELESHLGKLRFFRIIEIPKRISSTTEIINKLQKQ